eukprot:3007684-Prymnesium_polylepis.1
MSRRRTLACALVAGGVVIGLYLSRRKRKRVAELTVAAERDLDAAVAAAEGGDVLALTQWWLAFRHDGHSELLIAKETADAHRGRERSNNGSPLYRAGVCDAPAAVAHLISLGDDVNYSHPEHGDSPLLHCAQQGYDESLVACLVAPGIEPERARSVDVRQFLGQGAPLYDEGGLTPLALAARNGRLSTVQAILAHARARDAWLHATDSFGRGLVAATCEQSALTDSEWKQSALTDIVRALCDAGGVDAAAALRERPSREAALEAERLRQRTVRARCLRKEKERDAAARARGLAEIARSYRPTHPSVYDFRSPRDVLAVDVVRDVQEPIAGTLAFPLLPPD